MAVSARSSYVLAAALVLVAPAPVRAQAPRALIGLVRDSAGRAIPSAEVRARGNVLVARTDDSGRFHVAQMPVGARGVLVRRLGFAPQRALIPVSAASTTDSIFVTLAAVIAELPSVTALAYHDSLSRQVLAEFWARKARGFGKFVTRDDIEERGGMFFVDLVRKVPSVRVQNVRGRPEIRFSRNAGRDCPPQYWVDGIPLERGSADEFAPDNVEAIELYASAATTPPQYSTRNIACGTIIIWSRLPG